MSKKFESSSQSSDNRTLSVERLYGEPRLLIDGDRRIGFLVAASDAPALALAIIEAAGIWAGAKSDEALTAVESAARALHEHVNVQRAMAEEAAALEKLTKRRNELAAELGTKKAASYLSISGTSQRAIDRIIELEDKAQS